MTPRALSSIVAGVAGLAGMFGLAACGGGTGSDANPSRLWLVNDRVETEVKLTDVEPHPF